MLGRRNEKRLADEFGMHTYEQACARANNEYMAKVRNGFEEDDILSCAQDGPARSKLEETRRIFVEEHGCLADVQAITEKVFHAKNVLLLF